MCCFHHKATTTRSFLNHEEGEANFNEQRATSNEQQWILNRQVAKCTKPATGSEFAGVAIQGFFRRCDQGCIPLQATGMDYTARIILAGKTSTKEVNVITPGTPAAAPAFIMLFLWVAVPVIYTHTSTMLSFFIGACPEWHKPRSGLKRRKWPALSGSPARSSARGGPRAKSFSL